jgi:hypothetical protein
MTLKDVWHVCFATYGEALDDKSNDTYSIHPDQKQAQEEYQRHLEAGAISAGFGPIADGSEHWVDF